LRSGGIARLKEVPLVAVEIFKHSDGAVGFLAGSFEEVYTGGLHEAIVSPEMIGVKEEENAAGGLIADLSQLLRCVGLGEEEVCAMRPGRCDDEPALSTGKRRILDDTEPEGFSEKREGFVVITDEEGNVS
jgi:hypothetical protein